MNEQKHIDFHPVTVADKPLFDYYILSSDEQNCDLNFANIFCWSDTYHSEVAEAEVPEQLPGQEVYYCYTEEERQAAIDKLGSNAEITRFKGLGEISKDEFKGFIGKEIRLDQVPLRKEDAVKDLLNFYMGKNTTERQNFIINNLVVEEDVE